MDLLLLFPKVILAQIAAKCKCLAHKEIFYVRKYDMHRCWILSTFCKFDFKHTYFFHICRSLYPPGKVQLHHSVDIWFQIFTIHDKHVIEGCFIHHHLFDDTLQIVHFNFSYYDFNGAWNIDYAEWMKM